MSSQRRKQEAQKADQLIQEQAELAAQQAQTPPADPPEDPEADKQAADGADAGNKGEQPGEGGEQHTAASESSASGEEEGTPREDTAEYWKHKFKSLDGILRQRDGQIEQMRDMLASMQQSMQHMSQSQQQAPAQTQESNSKPLVTKEDEDAFGADLVDLVTRAAKQAIAPLREELRNEYNTLSSDVSKVNDTVKQTAQEKFESKLDEKAEGWRELDSDPAFIEWLRASRTRNQHWALAVQNLDHEAVAEMFDTYKLLNKQADAEREAPRNKRKQELQNQVAPGKSKSTSKPNQDAGEPKTWTASEIARTFDNRKSYGPKEWAALEREIFDAQANGRVDYSK